MARDLGPGAQLAKLDICRAYRIVPVHPQDRPLLGMSWRDQCYIDTTLPFGLRSAPKIFSALADALLWAMYQNGVQHALHYLDDFLFAGEPDGTQCKAHLESALATCTTLGVPIAADKVEGPATTLTFLGIEIDSTTMQLRLPERKLRDLRNSISGWCSRRACTKRELLSLIGQLQHAASVVKPGRTFLRRLIDLSCSVTRPHHHVRLSQAARSDILWWKVFITRWNGVSFLPPAQPQHYLESDASGSWGCAAIWRYQWFQTEWNAAWHTSNIACKELLPILLAAATWGKYWEDSTVLCLCDNAAVVAVINSGWCRDKPMMQLMRCLFFYAAHFHFTLSAQHTPGATNTLADALSRNNINRFRSLCPQASPHPTPVPQEALQLAHTNAPDWTSESWSQQFTSSLTVA